MASVAESPLVVVSVTTILTLVRERGGREYWEQRKNRIENRDVHSISELKDLSLPRLFSTF